MHICYLGNAKSIHLLRLAEYFAKEGHEIDLISFHSPDGEIKGVRVHYLNPGWSGYYEAAYIVKSPRVAALIRKLKPDLLHAHFLTNYGCCAALTGFFPIVASAWGSDVLVHPKRSWRFRLMAGYAAAKAAVVLSESEEATEAVVQVLGAAPDKVRTLPWGIDVDRFLLGAAPGAVKELRSLLRVPDGDRIVFSPRSLTPIYNIRTILCAVPEVIKENPKTTFIVARGFGSPAYEAKMVDLAATLGVQRHLRFVGRTVSDSEMTTLFCASDIMLSVPYSDSASVALVEGMLCGSIPIVSDLRCNRAAVVDGKNGLVVPVGDASALARAINVALRDVEGLKARFAPINREYVIRDRAWSVWAKKLESVYEEVVRGGTPAREDRLALQ